MLEIKPLTQKDIDVMSKTALEPLVGYPSCDEVPPDTHAAWVGDKLIGCGGVIKLWDGVGEGWLAVHREHSKHREFLLALCIRDLLDRAIRDKGYWRIQAVVRSDFDKAIRLVEALDFVREGEMKQYCPDKCSAYIYARII